MVEPEWLVSGRRDNNEAVPLVGRLSPPVDLARLRAATAELLQRVPLVHEHSRQVALQIRPGSSDACYESCGKPREIASEGEYNLVNPELNGTYFAELLGAFPVPICRARLLALRPKSCYSVHRDDAPRYHIAVQTSADAQFIFVQLERVFHIPADGRIYVVDTRELHTAINGGDDLRIHVVAAGA